MSKRLWIALAFLLVFATAGMIVHGQLVDARLENLSEDPTGSTGRAYFNTTSNSAKIYNGTLWTSLGGSGTGEKTYVPTGSESSATGWFVSAASSITATTDTTAADLPSPYVTKSGLKLLPANTKTDYAYLILTQLDPADYNKKMKVQFNQSALASYTSNDISVEVHSCTSAPTGAANTAITCAGDTQLPLSTDSSSVSGLPNLTGTFRTTFDSPGGSASFLYLKFKQNSSSATHAIVVSDIVVGPGVVTQGYAGQDLGALTVTVSGNGSKTFTNTANGWREGDNLRIKFFLVGNSTASGSAGSTTFVMNLPTGYTINTAALPAGAGNEGTALGRAQAYGVATASQYDAAASVYAASTTSVAFIQPNTVGNVYTIKELNVARAVEFFGEVVIPVNEWAGSGTVNVVQNTPEFACSTTGTWDAAAATGNTLYGQAGCPITGALTVQRIKDLQWQYPQGAGDVVDLYIKYNGVWTLASGLFPFCAQGTVLGGEQAYPLSSTQYEVTFYQYSACTGASFGAVGQAWTSTATAWVAVKHSGNQAVGFGAANTTSSGLVSYEDSGTFSVTWAGPATPTTTIGYARVGKIITLYFPRTTQTCSSAAAFTASAVVPSGLRPAHASFFPEYVEDNSVNQTTSGTLTVFANGNLEIDKTFATSAFTGSGACGFFEASFTYSTY